MSKDIFALVEIEERGGEVRSLLLFTTREAAVEHAIQGAWADEFLRDRVGEEALRDVLNADGHYSDCAIRTEIWATTLD